MDNDINSRNSDNYIDINGKPVKRVAVINPDGSQNNPTDGSQVTKIKETPPTDPSKNNPSVSITEVVVGTITTKTFQKTINTTVYQKTIAMDSSDNSVTISVWSQL